MEKLLIVFTSLKFSVFRNNLKVLFLSLLLLTASACSKKEISQKEAQLMLVQAAFSPEQIFNKHESFYMKSERYIDKALGAKNYISELTKESYEINSIFENKVVSEFYVQEDKLRLSFYLESPLSPLELHIVYDGEFLWCVSNFAPEDKMKVSLEQAKAFIGFPKSDLFQRIRADFEQSGSQIEYRHRGERKYNGFICDFIEMSLKGNSDKVATFFIDKKTNMVIKTGWSGIFPNKAEIKQIKKLKGKSYPSSIEISYGQYFAEIIKYSLKIDEHINPSVFNRDEIVLPLRNIYKEKGDSEEKLERRRSRIRVIMDSMKSFNFVLENMHLENFSEDFGTPFDGEVKAIVLPVLEDTFIPANAADYKIPLAVEIYEMEEKRKELLLRRERAAAKARAEAQAKREAEAKKREEADALSVEDAYKSIEEELEEMKYSDPEEYIKMKKILEEMKEKEERIRMITSN